MGGHRLTGPYWANFIGSVVANGEQEIELWGIGFREFVPTFAAIAARWNVRDLKLAQCFGAHFSCRVTASAISGELWASLEVHDPLSHDRTRRVPRTEEQDVVMGVHLRRQLQQVGEQQDCSAFGFTALTKALRNLPSTCGAKASTSMLCPERKSRASSKR